MAKNLNARLQHKIDSAENWGKATNFTPLLGELIIYSDGAGGESIPRIKVGDGVTLVGNLPWSQTASVTEFDVDEGGVLFGEATDRAATPIAISSASELNEILSNATSADVGKAYLYTGETTEEYENNAIYVIKEI